MTTLVYSDPSYLLPQASNSIVPLSSDTLHLVNATLDELLHITVHAVLLHSPSTLNEAHFPVTIDRFKSTFQRIVGSQLGKECVLEAELAVRELLRRSGNGNALKADPALASSSSTPSNVNTGGEAVERDKLGEEIFASLREWVMQISGFGALCPSTGPANLTTHLAELIAHRHPPAPCSARISFVLALYVDRTFSSLISHLLESILSIVSRSSTSRVANVQDLEVGFKEDRQVWSWVRDMKVKETIEREASRERQGSERLKSPTFGNSFAAAQQQQQQLPMLGQRKGSVSSSNAGLGIRRGSVDSTSGSTASGGGGGGGGSMVNSSHRRKPSLALSVVQSLNSNLSNDDPFDQLLNSGQTMRLSVTPDRLKLIKVERARKQASERDLRRKAAGGGGGGGASLASVPIPETTTTSLPVNAANRRKLKAREPQPKDLFNEEDEDADLGLEGVDAPKRKTTTQSLMDLLNSPPPWSGSTVGGAPMETSDSQNTVSSGMTGMTSGSSGGEDAWVNVSPQKRQKGLKAKDEKRDLASERQINNDLVSFFRNSPPTSVVGLPTSSSSAPPASPPLAAKRSRGGLRGFMSKVTGGAGGSRTDNNARRIASQDASIPSPNPFMSPDLEEPPAPLPSAESRPPRMRSISAQSNRSFASQATSTTYALPPGLGETPAKDKRRSPRERQRSESIAAEIKANRGERLQLSTVRPRSPSLSPPLSHQPPVSILKSNSKRSSRSQISSTESTPSLPPPVPLLPPTTASSTANSTSSSSVATVVRPQRSSSLKRKPLARAREASAASSTGPDPTTVPLTEIPVAPFPVAVPAGLVAASLDEDGFHDSNQSTPERLTSSEGGSHRARHPSDSLNYHEDGGGGGDTTEETDHQEMSQSRTISASPPPSSPVKLKQLFLVDSSAIAPTSTTLAKRGSVAAGGERRSSHRLVPSSASSSPTPTTMTSTLDGSQDTNGLGISLKTGDSREDKIVRILEELRIEMKENCSNREQCLDLVDALLSKYDSTGKGGQQVLRQEGEVHERDESTLVQHFLEG